VDETKSWGYSNKGPNQALDGDRSDEGMRTFVAAKLHNLRVTNKNIDYHGSVSISEELMRAVGIAPYEQVHVINLNTGARWVTYAISAAQPGIFMLNGGGARLGEVGDPCVVMTYKQEASFSGAIVVHFTTDEQGFNVINGALEYEGS
jgi:aspartate 1-decarboxylase